MAKGKGRNSVAQTSIEAEIKRRRAIAATLKGTKYDFPVSFVLFESVLQSVVPSKPRGGGGREEEKGHGSTLPGKELPITAAINLEIFRVTRLSNR